MTPQPFNRTSFITLNSNRLFTAEQVADLIQEHTPHTPAVPDLSHLTEDRRGCITCLNEDCPVWQTADQNCWRSQKDHDTTIRNQTLDAFAREIQQRYVGNYDNEAGDIPEVPIDEIAEIIESLRTQSTEQQPDTIKKVDYLRSLGWMVAVHNDYRQNGEFHTFWLLTHPDGMYFKGEGKTDDDALEQIAEQLRTQSTEAPK